MGVLEGMLLQYLLLTLINSSFQSNPYVTLLLVEKNLVNAKTSVAGQKFKFKSLSTQVIYRTHRFPFALFRDRFQC